jgi:hypothetical protein
MSARPLVVVDFRLRCGRALAGAVWRIIIVAHGSYLIPDDSNVSNMRFLSRKSIERILRKGGAPSLSLRSVRFERWSASADFRLTLALNADACDDCFVEQIAPRFRPAIL